VNIKNPAAYAAGSPLTCATIESAFEIIWRRDRKFKDATYEKRIAFRLSRDKLTGTTLLGIS